MTGNRYKTTVIVLTICAVAILFTLVTDNNANEAQYQVTVNIEPTLEWRAIATPTIDWCSGWWCTLEGVVYAGRTGSGNELPGALVRLSQFSYCSPTGGQHETTTGPDGAFEFDVYLHDTDGFRIQVELEKYEPTSTSFDGFDCLFCSCLPVEIVLHASMALNKNATPTDGLRNNDTLTYALTLSSPGLSVRLRDPLPAAVRYVSGSITSTVTPAAVYSPTVNAVIWQGTLATGTDQTIRFQVTPRGTGVGSLDLAPPIINTAWLTNMRNSRIVSTTVIVNGWSVYLPLVVRNH